MLRQSHLARLSSAFGQQRKLFLLVFLWTCLCLVIFKSSLLASSANSSGGSQTPVAAPLQQRSTSAGKLHERAAAAAAALTSSSPGLLASIQQPATHTTAASGGSSAGAAKQQLAAGLAGSQCKYNYPNLFDLQFNNIHWQKFTIRASQLEPTEKRRAKNEASASDVTYYLYNAYYDDRWRAGLPSVRVLAMVDRVQPPPTNCLLWYRHATTASSTSTSSANQQSSRQLPLVTRATFVYAWYPKWGNYKDGLLQPWIVTCPLPAAQANLVPDSVSLVAVPLPVASNNELDDASLPAAGSADEASRRRRNVDGEPPAASIAMPPSFSSSSAPSGINLNGQHHSSVSIDLQQAASTKPISEDNNAKLSVSYDCKSLEREPITNNLPVFNERPKVKGKFAVCVKGLDFPNEDVSVRLIEWIELLNLLGAGKIFLYELDVHENISKVLHYYQKRGIVELSPLTLPGDQPNLPEYQHAYLKNRLTVKRQNELIPYNDCLYRNLYSYEYLALLDIDEIIMPMRSGHHTWHDLMADVERQSLSEQNYSRASYNVRNVYFFDDLAGPLGTSVSPNHRAAAVEDQEKEEDQEEQTDRQDLERGIPHYLHMMQHVYRSKNYTKPGQYVKCFHNTERVVSLHNHFPMNCFGQCTTYSIPVELAHLQHYRKDCVGPLKQSCKNDYRAFTQRDTTIWKYKQQMIRRTTRVLNHLGLLTNFN